MKHTIEQVNVTKDLGVQVTDDAKYDELIDNMCKKYAKNHDWSCALLHQKSVLHEKCI